MTHDEAQKLGFREWTDHYEKEQEADRSKVNQLTDAVAQLNGTVGALSADVRTLIENQKGMFNRINKPVQWGVLISGLGLVALVLGLVTIPIKEDIAHIEVSSQIENERHLGVHTGLKQRLDDTRRIAIENETNLKWLIKLEERSNRRIHSDVGS